MPGKNVPDKALDHQEQIPQLVWSERVLGARKSHVANAAREKEQGRENQKGPGATGSWSYSLLTKNKGCIFPKDLYKPLPQQNLGK